MEVGVGVICSVQEGLSGKVDLVRILGNCVAKLRVWQLDDKEG